MEVTAQPVLPRRFSFLVEVILSGHARVDLA
jgi:hypothetical protein